MALLLKAHCPDCEIWEGDGLDPALARAQAHPDAEVALLDLNMPGMDACRAFTVRGRRITVLPGNEEESASAYVPELRK